MPATITQLLRRGGAVLHDCSPTPALDARVLLQWAARASHIRIITNPEAAPGAWARLRFRHALRRRRNGESVALITRRKEFRGLTLALNRSVLAPRPETEMLVDCALALAPPATTCRIADLGTGSGALALALATERPTCTVLATDSERRALAIARLNATRHGIHNIRFRRGHWCAALHGARFHIIVSNPPYIAAHDPCLGGDGLRYEPRTALVAGATGLEALATIIESAPAHLLDGGHLLLEHGATQGKAVRARMATAGFSAIRTHRDLAGHERVSAATFHRRSLQ